MTDAEKIVALVHERAEHVGEIMRINRELDAFRVKCPTCRCRLLPGATCECCADVDLEDSRI